MKAVKNYVGTKAFQFASLWKPAFWERGSLISNILIYPGIWIPLVGCHLVAVWFAGSNFGIPFLFWLDSPIMGFFSGFTTALFCTLGVFLFFLLDYSERSKEFQQFSDSDFAELEGSKRHWSDRLFVHFVKRTEGEISAEKFRGVLDGFKKSLRLQAFVFRSANLSFAFLFTAFFLLRVIISAVFAVMEKESFYTVFFHGRAAGATTFFAPILGFVSGTIFINLIQNVRVFLVLKWSKSKESMPRGTARMRKALKHHAWVIFAWLLAFYLLLWGIEMKEAYFSWGALASMLGWVMFFYTLGVFLFRLFSPLVRLVFMVGFVGLIILFFQGRYGFEGFDQDTFLKRIPTIRDEFESTVSPGEDRDEFQGSGLTFEDLEWKESGDGLGGLITPGGFSSRSKEQPLVVVCASGGGIAAEVFSIQMLYHLTKASKFKESVRIITGASGGMVGAAAWAGNFTQVSPEVDVAVENEALRERCATDQLSPIVHRMCLWDFSLPGMVGLQLPFGANTDRGNRLEQIWMGRPVPETGFFTRQLKRVPTEGPILPQLGQTLGQRKDAVKSGKIPGIIFSPTIAEDGRPLLVSNLDVGRIVNAATNERELTGVTTPTIQYDLVRCGVDAREVFGSEFVDSIPIGTWARMSASFPFVTPAGEIAYRFGDDSENGDDETDQIEDSIHPVDAGYVDNFGTSLALKWLEEYWLPALINDPKSVPTRVILIELDAFSRYGKQGGWVFEGKGPLDKVLERAFKDLVIPLKGASKRMRSVVYRTDQNLESFEKRIEAIRSTELGQRVNPSFKSFRFVNPVDSSLSWRLVKSDEDQLLNLTNTLDYIEQGSTTIDAYKNQEIMRYLESEMKEFFDYWNENVLK